jgi:hypothetical protein
VEQYFRNVIRNSIEERKRTGTKRRDFLQLLIELKEKGKLVDDDPSDKQECDDDEYIKNNYTALSKKRELL